MNIGNMYLCQFYDYIYQHVIAVYVADLSEFIID